MSDRKWAYTSGAKITIETEWSCGKIQNANQLERGTKSVSATEEKESRYQCLCWQDSKESRHLNCPTNVCDSHCSTWVEPKEIKLCMLELQSLTLLYLFQLYCHKAGVVNLMWSSGEVYVCGSSVYMCVKPWDPLWTWNFSASCASLSHEVMGEPLYPVWRWKDVVSELLWWSIPMGYPWVKEMVATQDRSFKSGQRIGFFSWDL